MENSRFPLRSPSPAESSLSFPNSTGRRGNIADNTRQGTDEEFFFSQQGQVDPIPELDGGLASLRIDDDDDGLYLERSFHESSNSNFQLGTSNSNLSAPSWMIESHLAGPSSSQNRALNFNLSEPVWRKDSGFTGSSTSQNRTLNSNVSASPWSRDSDFAGPSSSSQNRTLSSNVSASPWSRDSDFAGPSFSSQNRTLSSNVSASPWSRDFGFAGPSSSYNHTWNSDLSASVWRRDSYLADPSSSSYNRIWYSDLPASPRRRDSALAGPSSLDCTWNFNLSASVGRRDSDLAGVSSSHNWTWNSNLSVPVQRSDSNLAGLPSHNFTSDSDLSAFIEMNSDLIGHSFSRNLTSDSDPSIPLYCPYHNPRVDDVYTLESLHNSNRFTEQGRRSGSLGGHTLSAIRTELRRLDMEGICFVVKDKYGFEILQEMLLSGSPDEVEVIVKEAIAHIFELMAAPYGNVLVRKIFQVCTEDQMIRIITTLVDVPVAFVSTCKNQLGSKAVQLLIEKIKNSPLVKFVANVLNSEFTTLVTDEYGHQVLDRCLEQLKFEECEGIICKAEIHCLDIATQRFGYLVLKNCIKSSMENESGYIGRFIEKITSRALVLAKHAYGNYVIQQIIDLKSPIADQILMSQFEGHFADLSITKAGAYVVEKCIENWSNKDMIVYELLSTPRFVLLMQNQFANYIISTALKFCKGRVKAELIRAIVPHIEELRNNPHCKRLISKVCNITGR